MIKATLLWVQLVKAFQLQPRAHLCSSHNRLCKLILISAAGVWYMIMKISGCSLTCLITHWIHGDHSSCWSFLQALLVDRVRASAAIIQSICVCLEKSVTWQIVRTFVNRKCLLNAVRPGASANWTEHFLNSSGCIITPKMYFTAFTVIFTVICTISFN